MEEKTFRELVRKQGELIIGGATYEERLELFEIQEEIVARFPDTKTAGALAEPDTTLWRQRKTLLLETEIEVLGRILPSL